MRAVWQGWVAITARFGSNDIDDVRRAMDLRVRPAPPWRHHIWFDSWFVLLIAWIPVEVLLALVLPHGSGRSPSWQEAAIYGPTAVIGAGLIWCAICKQFEPPPPLRYTRPPATPQAPKRSRRQRAREESRRSSHVPSGRPQGPTPRSRPRTWAVALLFAGLLGLRLWGMAH